MNGPQVVRVLCDAGCVTSLQNADGYTGWALAESLERADVLALGQPELDAIAQRARARRTQEMAGGRSPQLITRMGTGLESHQSY